MQRHEAEVSNSDWQHPKRSCGKRRSWEELAPFQQPAPKHHFQDLRLEAGKNWNGKGEGAGHNDRRRKTNGYETEGQEVPPTPAHPNQATVFQATWECTLISGFQAERPEVGLGKGLAAGGTCLSSSLLPFFLSILLSPFSLSFLQMESGMQMGALSCLSLILLLLSQVPGIQNQEFQFGPCRVQGVVLQTLWEAFGAMRETVQAQDNITSIRLLHQEVLQNVSDAESCYLVQALLKFYLDTVFKNYHNKTVVSQNLKSFSTLANNFIAISSKLQPSQEIEMFSIRESARRRFLLFHGAFKRLDIEAALTKAFGEVDIFLTWMGKFYKPNA
ncbi:interleukin-24 [Tupaia chinensis]|uniref:interleukin-24 n=1 Tax=Tupaia chinensis TaxID=246437 RepID=UPI0003C8DA55|nr:interleukin-24 [Tupaia chinensis]